MCRPSLPLCHGHYGFSEVTHPADDFLKMCPVGHDPRMLENVIKGMLYPLPDAVVRLAMAAAVYNIAARSGYTPVLVHAANLRASGVDWSVK